MWDFVLGVEDRPVPRQQILDIFREPFIIFETSLLVSHPSSNLKLVRFTAEVPATGFLSWAHLELVRSMLSTKV